MFHHRSRTLWFALAGGLATTAAQAATITFFGSIPLRNTNFSQAVSIAQFDSALGTLESVTVTVNAGFEGKTFGENMNPNAPAEYTAQLTYQVGVTGPNGFPIVDVTGFIADAGTLNAFDGLLDFAGVSGFTRFQNDARSAVNSFTEAADLASFTGAGWVSFLVDATASSSVSGSSGLIALGTGARAWADVEVTYTYTAVPAPAGAIVLAGAGLLGARRRRAV